MAVKRVRFCRVTADGTTTTFHLETSSDIVLRPDGTSVEQALQSFANTGSIGGGGGTSSGGASSAELQALKDQVSALATAALTHATTDQLKALESSLTEKINAKANKAVGTKFTIAANAWVSDNTEGYPYYYNISAPNVTAADKADVTLSPSAIDVAATASICPTVETINGGVRLRAKYQPTGVISGEYYIQ